MDAIVARQDNHHKTLQTERLQSFSDPGPVFHTIVSTKNDGHYFCGAGGNRPDGLNEPVTDFLVLASKPAAARTVQSLTQAPVILLTHPRMGEQLFQFEPREVRRIFAGEYEIRGNDSNLLIVFYVQIMPDDFVMQLHRF